MQIEKIGIVVADELTNIPSAGMFCASCWRTGLARWSSFTRDATLGDCRLAVGEFLPTTAT
jgi:hypothetical protein